MKLQDTAIRTLAGTQARPGSSTPEAGAAGREAHTTSARNAQRNAGARASIALQMAPHIRRLPDRAAGRLSDKCAEVDDLLASGYFKKAMNRAANSILSEWAKLARTKPEAAATLALKITPQLIGLAIQIAGYRPKRRPADEREGAR